MKVSFYLDRMNKPDDPVGISFGTLRFRDAFCAYLLIYKYMYCFECSVKTKQPKGNKHGKEI
jgi:hypothetical protein